MARKKKVSADAGDIPAWFMTYSDVITLLMTFFILLLTFATNEPERFERIQVSMFGEGGSTGIAGHKLDGIERDSWVYRIRPRSARMVMRGTEMPPFKNDPTIAKASGELAGIEDPGDIDLSRTFKIELPLNHLIDANGQITDKGEQIARMISKQLRHIPFEGHLEFNEKRHTDRAVAFADHLYHVERIRPGQFGISFAPASEFKKDNVRIVFERFMRES